MNSCRKLGNVGEDVYLRIRDGTATKVDYSSSLHIKTKFPNWILYTEVIGLSKGTYLPRQRSYEGSLQNTNGVD